MTVNDTKYVGDEFVDEEEISKSEDEKAMEGLYDLVLPPGIPHKLILEAVDMFNLEVTIRKCAVKTIDVDDDNLLTLRGELASVNQAHDYIFQKLSERYKYKK